MAACDQQFRRRLVCGPLLLTSVWIVAISTGAYTLWRHTSTPGAAGQPPQQWPARTTVKRDFERPTLLLFAHPRCPCTRASLGELARIVSRRESALDTHVFFYKPDGSTSAWEQTDLYASAETIPGVRVKLDPDGVEASRFGVKTSGHALLYDRCGRLVFSGGITAARGHAGDSRGRSEILSWLDSGATTRGQASVFGCSLTCTPTGLE